MAGFRGGEQRAENRDYVVRAFDAPKELKEDFDELALSAGQLYTGAMVEFWRVVRRHGVWLRETGLRQLCYGVERWDDCLMHSNSRQATVSAFMDALSTWRTNRKEDSTVRPPHKRKRFFKVVWVQMGIKLRYDPDGPVLLLSRNQGRPPLEVPLPAYLADIGTITKVEAGWKKGAGGYELRLTWTTDLPEPLASSGAPVVLAGVDLGEVHPFVISDGTRTVVYNGRELRSKRRYRNKLVGTLDARISRTKPGSRRRRKLVRSKHKQLRKLNHQLRDAEHKLSSRAVADMVDAGVTHMVVGDLRDIYRKNPSKKNETERLKSKGRVFNQKLHQAPLGRSRDYLTYKSRRSGIVPLSPIGEGWTSKTCPRCGHRNTPTNRRYHCRRCGLHAHRDAVGAWNIHAKYLGLVPWGTIPTTSDRVVGAVAAPTFVRFHPHLRSWKRPAGVVVPEATASVAA